MNKNLRNVVESKIYEHLNEMKNNGFLVVHADTNEPQTDWLGKTIIYANERSAKAAIASMPSSKRKDYFVDPNFE